MINDHGITSRTLRSLGPADLLGEGNAGIGQEYLAPLLALRKVCSNGGRGVVIQYHPA